jgi:hypothetical protein
MLYAVIGFQVKKMEGDQQSRSEVQGGIRGVTATEAEE